MYKINGNCASASVFASNVEAEAEKQITEILGNEFLKEERVAIMPDCHAGN